MTVSSHRPTFEKAAQQLIFVFSNIGFWVKFSTFIAGLSIAVGLSLVVVSTLKQLGNPPTKLVTSIIRGHMATQISSPELALQRFNDKTGQNETSTLELGDVWIKVNQNTCSKGCEILLENTRSASSEFWIAAANQEFRNIASRVTTDGIRIHVPPTFGSDFEIVGRVNVLNLLPIRATQLNHSGHHYITESTSKDRLGGLLYGALLSLAAFSMVVSFLNKDVSFLILGGWLVTTARLAGFNGPWDLYWFGYRPDGVSNILFIKISLAFHGIVSVGLFITVLREHLGPRQTKTLILVAALLGANILTALFMSTTTFFRAFWVVAGTSFLLSQAMSIEIAFRTKLLHVWLFNASWFAIMAGAIFEIAFTSGLLSSKLLFVNAQTGAVASGILMAIAIADRMRRERNARLAIEKSLVQVFKKFKGLYGNVPVGLCTFNESLAVIEHNELMALAFLGQRKSNLQGLNAKKIFGESHDLFLTNLSEKKPRTLEYCASHVNGASWFRVNFKRVGTSIDCTFEDISERKANQLRIEYLAKFDPLTNTRNRHEFEKDLAVILENPAIRARTSVAHVDIKGFKLFNDLFGHAIGDEMLVQVAGRLSKYATANCQLYRLDGDDFFYIFTDHDALTVDHQAGIIQISVSQQHYIVNKRAMSLVAGVGVVHVSDGISATDIFASATQACKEAKERADTKVVSVGRGSEDLKLQIAERHLMASMKQRFPQERLFLQAQPIVPLADPRSALAYEVLVRMHGDDGGVIPPMQFIPAAEKNGLMSQIDRWVLDHTLVWLEQNPAHAKTTDFITVNLSGASLNDLRFAEDALEIIKEHRHLANKICFEITESVALFDLKTTLRFVEQTKSFGCRLALDDFGAGYTSFKYLKDIPCDIVKIDGSYVRTINKSVANHAIVKAITDLTHEMGMQCVAEWIEDLPTVKTLRKLGMDYGQGFAFCRPTELAKIAKCMSGFDSLPGSPVREFYSDLFSSSKVTPAFEGGKILVTTA
jgi:diguanylate cyclase (GGDEF)-like protein